MHGNIDCMEQPEEYQKMAVPGMLSDILRLQHRRNEPLEKSRVVKLQYGNVGVQSRRKSKFPPSPPLPNHVNTHLNQCYLSLLLIFHDKEKTAEINGVKRRG